MNFKKTWKRFFTVSRASEGFTLVELIVVIAILAILAGIAVPAYSGYIKKANKAADLQLLGAVNTAFAAAVLENGKDVNEIPDGSVRFRMSDKTVTMYDTEFQKYFAGNSGSEFKVITQLLFVDGNFVDPTSTTEGISTHGYGSTGTNVYLTDAELANIQGSSFGNMTTASLQNQLAGVTNFAQNLDSDIISSVMGSDAYKQCMADYLGITVEEFNSKLEDPNFGPTAYNGLVLFAAENAQSVISDDVTTLLSGGTAYNDILATLEGDPENGIAPNPEMALTQAALAYGMYTAYAYSTGDETLITKAQNPATALGELGDEDFLDYINNADNNGFAQQDLDAYLSALNAINSTAQSNPDTAAQLMGQGFGESNTDLKALIDSILAPNT